MEAIKVSIDIHVDLSDSTKQFLAACFMPHCNCGCNPIGTGTIPELVVPATPAVPTTPAVPATPATPQEPTPSKPADADVQATAAPATPSVAQEPKTEVTVEMIRKLVSAKAGTHREQLKKELNRLGAPNVTGLAKEHYNEFYNFLKSL